MLDEHFVILGALFNLCGSTGYVIDTLKGSTRPNRVSWFLWTLAPFIAFFAEIKDGVGLRSLMTFMVGVCPLMVFLASFVNRKSYWKLGWLDISCGALAILALVLWRMMGSGNVAIALSLAADFLAGVPTLIKSYHEPDSESDIAYLCGAISAAITLLTIKEWTLACAGFPIYILIACLVMYALIKFRLGKRKRIA